MMSNILEYENDVGFHLGKDGEANKVLKHRSDLRSGLGGSGQSGRGWGYL